MSKQELQAKTFEACGVSFDQSTRAAKLSPTLYQRIGEAGFQELSSTFYDLVFADKDAAWFLNIFSSSTKTEAIENQVRQARRLFFRSRRPEFCRQFAQKLTTEARPSDMTPTLLSQPFCNVVSILCPNIRWSRSV